MIYTLTINPSIDYYMNYGEKISKHQSTFITEEIAGGKGINASVILKNLGTESIAVFLAGGFNGQKLIKLTNDLKLNTAPIMVDLETRINVKINSGDETYEFNAKGASIDPVSINNKLMQIFAELKPEDYVMVMGSLPPGYEFKHLDQLLEFINSKKAKFIFDLSENLLNVLKYRPVLIKPNAKELSHFFNVEVTNKDEALAGAHKLIAMGAQNVLVSLDKSGAVFTNGKEEALISSAKIKEVNGSGAGDSMIAAALNGFIKGQPIEEILKMASGAGAATAASKGLGTKEDIEMYASQVEITMKGRK